MRCSRSKLLEYRCDLGPNLTFAINKGISENYGPFVPQTY